MGDTGAMLELQDLCTRSNDEIFDVLSSLSVDEIKDHGAEKSVSDAWFHLVSNVTDKEPDLRKKILQICTDQIIPVMQEPFLLLDFLTSSCELGGIFRILSLKSVFLLIQRYNLDFPSFYDRLYELLDSNILHTKYRELLFDQLETFLSSTHLPAYLICAFLKRLARLALGAPTTAIMWIVPFVYNMIKQHPTCSVLLHRIEAKSSNNESACLDSQLQLNDPFVWNADLKGCNALQSSLWELVAIREHFYFKTASRTKILVQKMTKPPFILKDYVQFSVEQFMQTERERNIKTPAALSIRSIDEALLF